MSNGSCSEISNTAVLNVNNLTGINQNNSSGYLLLFPNPANTTLTIDASITIAGLRIVNTVGEVINANFNGKVIDVSHLSNGIYFLQLLDDSQDILKTVKFVKQSD